MRVHDRSREYSWAAGPGESPVSEDDEAVEQGDEADEAGASDGASQLIPSVRRTVCRCDEARRPDRSMVKKTLRWTDLVACLVLIALAVRFGPRTPVWYTGAPALRDIASPLGGRATPARRTAFSAMPEARQLVTHGCTRRSGIPSTSLVAWRSSAASWLSRCGRSSSRG